MTVFVSWERDPILGSATLERVSQPAGTARPAEKIKGKKDDAREAIKDGICTR